MRAPFERLEFEKSPFLSLCSFSPGVRRPPGPRGTPATLPPQTPQPAGGGGGPQGGKGGSAEPAGGAGRRRGAAPARAGGVCAPPPPRHQRAARAGVYVPRGAADVSSRMLTLWRYRSSEWRRRVHPSDSSARSGRGGGGEIGPGERRRRTHRRPPPPAGLPGPAGPASSLPGAADAVPRPRAADGRTGGRGALPQRGACKQIRLHVTM